MLSEEQAAGIESRVQQADYAMTISELPTSSVWIYHYGACGTGEASARQDITALIQDWRAMAKELAEFRETYVDDFGTVWIRPTAWAYAQICRVSKEQAKELVAMREVVEAAKGVVSMRLTLMKMNPNDKRLNDCPENNLAKALASLPPTEIKP